jgi:hypothetical protein
MSQAITILTIDRDYEVFYWIIRDGTKIISKVALSQAMEMLRTTPIDLVLSEPQNLAILKPVFKKTNCLDRKDKNHNNPVTPV